MAQCAAVVPSRCEHGALVQVEEVEFEGRHLAETDASVGEQPDDGGVAPIVEVRPVALGEHGAHRVDRRHRHRHLMVWDRRRAHPVDRVRLDDALTGDVLEELLQRPVLPPSMFGRKRFSGTKFRPGEQVLDVPTGMFSRDVRR
ncbi:hypothetical protein [Nocardia amikacinitolerans]|uniref:hypothetical protein n=1 Tax=Nocardia amikacinitolerans TaxID=756689 RepID=UPI00117D1C23|nr:hypothetical protein [Nocardia amikacinitolerans]